VKQRPLELLSKLSETGRYYLISFITAAIFWLILIFLEIDFINIVFFIMAFVWHFALLAPGVREKILTSKNKLSFLSVTIRVNHYLQMFLPVHKIPRGPALVRALSPLVFSFMLFVAGGIGNLFFTLLGSLVFEFTYGIFLHKKVITMNISDPETPPAIPSYDSDSK
jgi:hypothetical protein